MAAPAFIEELQLVGWPATTRSVDGRAGLVTTMTSPIAAYCRAFCELNYQQDRWRCLAADSAR
jgi:hypothetical protein